MKSKSILILLLNLLGATAFAQNLFTKENLIKDLDAYRNCIALNHIDAFKKISKKEFFSELEKIKDSSARMNVDELYTELLKVNAKVGDEHTGISEPASSIFPFRAFWFEEGIFIYSTDSAHRQMSESKILSINNVPIDDIVRKLVLLLPSENAGTVKKTIPQYLASPQLLYGLKIIDRKDFAWFLITNPGGDTVKCRLEATGRKVSFETPANWNSFLRNTKKDNYWYKYDSIGHYIYFNYSKCIDDKQLPFETFQKEIMDIIKSAKPEKLIIDLRFNSGGNSTLLNPFIEEMKYSDINKNGKIYVLIGRRTFSSALLNAVDMKKKLHVILVGEETSGSINHFGEIKFFELPNTKLRMSYSTKLFLRDKNADGALKPDVVTPLKFDDFLNGVDAALDYAVRSK